MVHADSGTLMAYFDGEIPARDRSAIAVHLRECEPCASELAELQAMASQFSGALALADGQIPMLRTRARIEAIRPAALAGQTRRLFGMPADLLKAAAVILLVTGAASAAIPGTPLRRLIESVVERTATLFQTDPAQVPVVQATEQPIAPASAEQSVPGQSMGISASATGGRATVSIHSPVADSRIAIRLVGGNTLRVVSAGSDETVFTSSSTSIDAFQNTTGLVIEVPRSLMYLTVDVDGEVYFVKDGEGAGLTVPGTASGPDEFVFQARSD